MINCPHCQKPVSKYQLFISSLARKFICPLCSQESLLVRPPGQYIFISLLFVAVYAGLSALLSSEIRILLIWLIALLVVGLVNALFVVFTISLSKAVSP